MPLHFRIGRTPPFLSITDLVYILSNPSHRPNSLPYPTLGGPSFPCSDTHDRCGPCGNVVARPGHIARRFLASGATQPKTDSSSLETDPSSRPRPRDLSVLTLGQPYRSRCCCLRACRGVVRGQPGPSVSARSFEIPSIALGMALNGLRDHPLWLTELLAITDWTNDEALYLTDRKCAPVAPRIRTPHSRRASRHVKVEEHV